MRRTSAVVTEVDGTETNDDWTEVVRVEVTTTSPSFTSSTFTLNSRETTLQESHRYWTLVQHASARRLILVSYCITHTHSTHAQLHMHTYSTHTHSHTCWCTYFWFCVCIFSSKSRDCLKSHFGNSVQKRVKELLIQNIRISSSNSWNL